MASRVSNQHACVEPPQVAHCLRKDAKRGGNKMGSYWACTKCHERLIFKPSPGAGKTKQGQTPTTLTYYHLKPCGEAQANLQRHTRAICNVPLGSPSKERADTPPYPWLDRPAVVTTPTGQVQAPAGVAMVSPPVQALLTAEISRPSAFVSAMSELQRPLTREGVDIAF